MIHNLFNTPSRKELRDIFKYEIYFKYYWCYQGSGFTWALLFPRNFYTFYNRKIKEVMVMLGILLILSSVVFWILTNVYGIMSIIELISENFF
jgi:fatty acid desaturase